MIIVVTHIAETNQLQLQFEGGQPQQVKDALAQVVKMLDEQLKKPRLIVPQTVIPEDINRRTDGPQG